MRNERAAYIVVPVVVCLASVGCAAGPGSAAPTAAPAPEPAEPTTTPAQEADASGTATEPALQLRVVGTAGEQKSAGLAAELQKLSADGKPEQVNVHARYALAWGCPCAPIILADASGSPPPDSYLLPVVREGEASPADFAVTGGFRLIGKYAAKPMRFDAWLSSRGTPVQPSGIPDVESYLQTHYPTLLIDQWCYVPPPDLAQLEARTDDLAKKWAELIDRLRTEGRFCKPEAQ